uniref:mitogen-activated protein kinase kinase n=1 Tax=Catagonus wagneri TaxID=51154 RepID=A0A8C3VVG9_9CETA
VCAPALAQPGSSLSWKRKSRRKKDLRISCMSKPPAPSPTPPRNLDSRTFITIGDRNFEVEADDLVTISELGRGAYGVVEKVRHAQSGTIMAVKRIRATVNSQEQKRLLMDLDVNMRTVDCFYTVTFYGALFREGLRGWVAERSWHRRVPKPLLEGPRQVCVLVTFPWNLPWKRVKWGGQR